MPSTYTVNLGIEKPATGEQSGTWGDTTNVNFDILDQAINGAVRVTLTSAGSSGSPNALQITNGATSDGRNKWVEFYSSGDLGGSAYVQLDPNDAEKIVFVRNSLASSRSVILFQGTYNSARDLEVPAGVDMVVKFDGGGASAATVTDVYTKLRVTELTTPTLTATTADINGGTLDNSVIGGTTAAAITGTTIVANTSLNIAGDGATVTGIKDEDNMASNSATKLATQQSIKAYVDSQVGTVDTLAEILANGNTSGSNNLIIDNGQALTSNTINETTAGSGVTIDSVLLKDDVVNATDVETSSISANDGTAAATIANSTGNFTITSFISNSVDIGGGAIDGTNIGASSAGTGAFTTLTASGDLTVDTDTLYVDSTNDRVGINVASPTVALDVSSGAIHSQLRIHRNVAGDNTTMGTILFAGDDSDGNVTDYSRIVGLAESDNSGGEDGQLIFSVLRNASMTEAMRIDSSQRVLIEHTSAQTFSLTPQVSVLGTDASSSAYQVGRFQNGAFASYYQFAKSRATTVGNHAIVQDGDTIGNLRALADDGVNYDAVAASIEFAVDGTPGANDMPGRIAFSTSADGADSPTERMRISSTGKVTVNTPSSGTALEVNVIDNTADGFVVKQGSNEYISVDTTNSDEEVVLGNSTTNPSVVVKGTNLNINSSYIDFSGSVSTPSTAAAIYRPADNTLAFSTANTEAMRLDSSQRVLIGATSTRTVDGYNQHMLLEGAGITKSSFAMINHTNDANGAYFYLSKARGTTIGGSTIVQDGDVSGAIVFTAADGTDMASKTAQIQANVDGTPGSNDTPGRLQFYTTVDGGSAVTERMRIDNAGNVGIGTTLTGGPAKLHIAGSDSGDFKALTIRNGNGTTGSAAVLGFETSSGTIGDDASLAGQIKGIRLGGGTIGALSFLTTSSGVPTEAMRIDNGQRILIGYPDTFQVAGHNGAVQVVGQGTADYHGATTSIVGFSNNSNGAYLNFGSGRSNTAGTYTVVANDDTVGQINFSAADGTDMNSRAAHITTQIDGAPGSNDTPGRIMFFTSSDGSASPTERMRIDSAGRTFAGDLSYIGTVTTNSVFEAHGGSVVFGSGDGSNNQGYRTFVKFFQVNNSSGLPTSANLDLAGMTSEFYCKITVVGVNPYAGSNAFTYINESTGYAGGNFSVISANEYGAGTGISFGTATLVNTSGSLYSIRIPVTSSSGAYRFVATAEIIGISPQNDPSFTYS